MAPNPRVGRLRIFVGVGIALAVITASAVFFFGRSSEPVKRIVVPDTVGLTRGEAVDRIGALGLEFDVTRVSSPDVPSGLVVKQHPASGTRVPPQSEVVIQVSSGPS